MSEEGAAGTIRYLDKLPLAPIPSYDVLSVVITTHGKAEDLPIILKSLHQQREYVPGQCSRSGVKVLYTASQKFSYPFEVIVTCDGEYQGEDVPYAPILECPKQGGVGHHTREAGILQASGSWIILTNSDNYFVNGFLYALKRHLKSGVGLIYWDCLSNLWRWSTGGGSKLKRGHIDLSSVCVRADIATEVGFPFRNYDGDWDYIEACLKIVKEKKLSVSYINETLSVHN